MLNSVAIHGDGIAACCCAKLLQKRGIAVSFSKTARPNLPSLLISPSTQRLMADVFADQNIFDGFPVIRQRIVLWRDQAEPVILPHSGAVVSESMLLQRLWELLEIAPGENPPDNPSDWLVYSSKNLTDGQVMHFGSRLAVASTVALAAETAEDACYIEALGKGWLFLLPSSCGRGSLISVGGSVQSLMSESRLVAAQVHSFISESSLFPAYPRVLHPLCRPGWLACGTSALGFDPICGEGAGNAVREAILVSAALGFIATHSETELVLNHYSSRLLGGLLKHLILCRDFYSAGTQREWWEHELSALEEGIEWTTQHLSTLHKSSVNGRFQLVGFDLHRIA